MTWTRSHGDAVVYVGSEGERFVVAIDEPAVATILPYGEALFDMMAYARARILDEASRETPAFTTLDELVGSKESVAPWVAATLAELESRRIVAAEDPLSVVMTGNRELAREWFDACGRTLDRVEVVADDVAVDLRPYRATENYHVGEWIAHPTLGEGRVTAARPGLIAVRFSGGDKLLIHGKR